MLPHAGVSEVSVAVAYVLGHVGARRGRMSGRKVGGVSELALLARCASAVPSAPFSAVYQSAHPALFPPLASQHPSRTSYQVGRETQPVDRRCACGVVSRE